MGPLFLLGVFSPGIVAIALTASREGSPGVNRLLAPIGYVKADWRLYAFAIAYLPVIKLTGAVIYRASAGEWPPFGETPILLMLLAIPLSTITQAGEEIGWRGFLLPRLARSLGFGGAGVVIGAIWAAWHLPLFFLPFGGTTGQSIPIYVANVTALSVAMTWVYWRSGGSLLLVMVMHAAVNNTLDIVPGAVPGASDPWALSGSPTAYITITLSWALATVLLFRMRGARIPSTPSDPGPRAVVR